MTPYTCPCGQAYMPRQWTHCPACGLQTKRTAHKAQSRPKTKTAPLSVEKPARKPPIDNILATLRKRGMKTDTAIIDGLRTGAVMQVISWQLQYEYVIDYLESKGLDIGSYRYRVVCGSAELERKLNAA